MVPSDSARRRAQEVGGVSTGIGDFLSHSCQAVATGSPRADRTPVSTSSAVQNINTPGNPIFTNSDLRPISAPVLSSTQNRYLSIPLAVQTVQPVSVQVSASASAPPLDPTPPTATTPPIAPTPPSAPSPKPPDTDTFRISKIVSNFKPFVETMTSDVRAWLIDFEVKCKFHQIPPSFWLPTALACIGAASLEKIQRAGLDQIPAEDYTKF